MPDSAEAATPPAPPVATVSTVLAVDPPADAVESLYQQLAAQIVEQRPGEDLTPLRKAFEFARDRHSGQKRATGDPYICLLYTSRRGLSA